ncbi:MAG: hypothetical protein AAFY59_05210 [Pseudomonadota bacterium]
MATPFDIWAPVFRAPFSGDVTQEIEPNVHLGAVKGVAQIEHKVQTEVASYGTQLGKILEALQTLSSATQTPLPEIDTLVAQIEAVKAQSQDALRADAEAALLRLREADGDAWRDVVAACYREIKVP